MEEQINNLTKSGKWDFPLATYTSEGETLMKRITMLPNLVELIENEIITVCKVKSDTTIAADITETETIEPYDFVDSILYLNEAKLFRDAVDFFYEFKNDRLIHEVGMKNPYMDEKYIAECSIKDEVSNKDVEEKLRETIFSKAERETM